MWSHEALWLKARAYAARAAAAGQESGLFPFWSLLAYELVARAALANVHPALLADPREGHNLLYAFGHGDPKTPKSITFKTVLLRCQVVIPAFTDRHVQEGTALMELRNKELHSGDTPLEDLATSSWLPSYYEGLDVILDAQDLALEDLFEPDQAAAARQIVSVASEDLKTEVMSRIAAAAKTYEQLDDQTREEKERRAVSPDITGRESKRPVDCPACGKRALMDGEVSRWSAPRVGEANIVREAIVLPTSFACAVCGLRLGSHAEMFHAGLGDEYSAEYAEDPIEYYGIDVTELVDPSDFFELEYENE